MLGERGIDVSYETIRRWVLKFGPAFAATVRSRRVQPSGIWHLDEVFVRYCQIKLDEAAFPAPIFLQIGQTSIFDWLSPNISN